MTSTQETPESPQAVGEAPRLDPRVERLQQARDSGAEVTGTVIGWNRGGFHVAVDGLTAFCPRSEMEPGRPRAPQSYVDRELAFQVLNVRNRGKRIVLSRKGVAERQRRERRAEALARLQLGTKVEGRIVSLTDFGAFVDLGGVQGLIHKSELSHRAVENPAEVLSVGDRVTVQVLRIDEEGGRIGLSLRALEPDPWAEVAARFPEGAVVEGTVVRSERTGAFVELEPGVTGLLPSSAMALPADTTPERAFPAGKRVKVQVLKVEPRKRRIGLAREGAQLGGSEADYRAYVRRQKQTEGGFTPLAEALQRLQAGNEK
ncbi:MAG: 30S ribosomal protein S1 [Thermoanaerobaculia bacterium]